MFRKFLILTFLFFVPVTYLPYILQGYILQAVFFNILIVAITLSACVVTAPLITDFLTIKRNILIKLIVVSILIYCAIFAMSSFTPFIQITAGGLNPGLADSLPFLKAITITVDPRINMGITSLLMAIWGIIWNLLL